MPNCLRLVLGDATNLALRNETVDLIIADPPYNLSKDRPVSTTLFSYTTMDASWDHYEKGEYYLLTCRWLHEAKRVLKPSGTLFTFGTVHNMPMTACLLEQYGFRILNLITWAKTSAPPSITRRMFTDAAEFIIWACKGNKGWTFNYSRMKELNGGTQMRNVWRLSPPRREEKKFGKVLAQKPLSVLSRCIEAASKPGDLVLDLFAGSCSSSIAARSLDRRSIAYEIDPTGLQIGRRRWRDVQQIH